MNTITKRKQNVPAQYEAEWSRLSELSDTDLDAELSTMLEVTAKNLMKLALIIRVKEERGQDISNLRVGMVGYLRMIAYGQLLPEVVARFGSRPALLKRIAALPLPDQQSCLNDKGVKVAVWQGDEITHRVVDPIDLTQREVRQVFAADHIRKVDEQAHFLRELPLASRRAPNPIEVDKKHGAIIVTGDAVRISRAELLTYLARLG